MICDDLKVCGRREMGQLIRIRHKYQEIVKREAKRIADEEKAKTKQDEEPEDEDAKIDRELEETMLRIEKEKKRQAKKDKVAADKSELRKKMSVIATTTLDNDEDLMMSRKLWDDIRKKGFDRAGEASDDEKNGDQQSEDEETKVEAAGSSDSSDEDDDDEEGEDEQESSGDELFDEKEAQIAAMADQMEEHLAKKKSYEMTVDRKMAGKEYKKKALIEQQRLRLEDLEEQEALDNAGLLDNEDDDSDDALYK